MYNYICIPLTLDLKDEPCQLNSSVILPSSVNVYWESILSLPLLHSLIPTIYIMLCAKCLYRPKSNSWIITVKSLLKGANYTESSDEEYICDMICV